MAIAAVESTMVRTDVAEPKFCFRRYTFRACLANCGMLCSELIMQESVIRIRSVKVFGSDEVEEPIRVSIFDCYYNHFKKCAKSKST